MQAFEFATASRIIFGVGKRAELPKLIAAYGARRVFFVIGSSRGRAEPVLRLAEHAGAEVDLFSVPHEPDLDLIETGLAHLRAFQPDLIVGLGGGSVLDAAKVLAALEANGGPLLQYLEVIGLGNPLENPVRLPLIAMPTTAGTGSEVTRNGVVAAPTFRLKVSLRHSTMLPAVALVDPELTLELPAHITAYTGMDALVQLIEPLVSNAATPITHALCVQGLQAGLPALARCYANPDDLEARAAMSFASLMGGMALANAKLGAVHGFAGVLGGMFDAPHGALCARLLPPVIAANLAALRQRAPQSPALAGYEEIERLIRASGFPDLHGEGALEGWAWAMNAQLGIPALSHFGITEADLAEVAAKSAGSSSMKGNPVALTPYELIGVLRAAL